MQGGEAVLRLRYDGIGIARDVLPRIFELFVQVDHASTKAQGGLGIGLTVTNSKAVMEALFGIKSAFARTPKYRVAKKGEKTHAAKYRKRLKLAPWIELIIGAYFFLAIIYCFSNHNYFTAPFLILFVIGYWYTGLMSLLQGRFERWRGGANTTDESSPKPFPVGV